MSKLIKPGYTRKQFLKTVLAGGGGLAALNVLGGCDARSYTRRERVSAAQTIPFNTGWLFGGKSTGSTGPGIDDSAFEQVTLPHSVTELSCRQCDPKRREKFGYIAVTSASTNIL